MDNGLIPNRYAKALYKYAAEKGCADRIYDEMRLLCKSFENNAELNKTLCNPYSSLDDKEKILLTAAGTSSDDILIDFFRLMIRHNRLELFRIACLFYLEVYSKATGLMHVEVQSAVPITNRIKDKIGDILNKEFPQKKFETTYNVNPDIIGGFVINTRTSILDASVATELNRFRSKLINQDRND